MIELLAEVPIAASLGRIGPIPTHIDRRRRRHSIGGDDGAQCDTVKDRAVVGSGGASMPNYHVTASDDCDMTGHRDIST